MKNKIIIILIIFIVILSISIYMVYSYRKNIYDYQETTRTYEAYYNKQILGTELISIINRTIDINQKIIYLKTQKAYILKMIITQ